MEAVGYKPPGFEFIDGPINILFLPETPTYNQ